MRNEQVNRAHEAANLKENPDRIGVSLMSSVELRAVPGMLMRQWRLIFTVALLIVLVAAAVLSQIRNRYTAETLLNIDERGSQLLGQETAVAMGVTLNDQVDTEVEILGSTSVAMDVIDRLALWRDPEFGFNNISYLDSIKSLIGISVAAPTPPAASRLTEIPPDLQAQLVKKLQNSSKITRRGLTSIISIKATSKNAEKSALIANSMADSYLDLQIDSKVATTKRAASFLSARVDQIAKNIQDLDAKIESFILTQSDVIGTPEARTELKRMRDEIDSLTSTQTLFKTEMAQLQNIENDPSTAQPSSVSAELRELAEKRVELANQLSAADVSNDIENQLKEIDQKLVDAAKLRTDSIQDELAKSDKQKIDLSKQLQVLFSQQKIPSEVAVSLFRLQREAENNRKLYDNYSARLGEVQQQVNLVLPNARIVAPAIVPHDASYPASLLILGLSSIFGLGLGTAMAVIREHLIGGFASSEQLEALTGKPILATIPKYTERDPHDAIVSAPFSTFSESVRRLRIGVENTLGHLGSKSIMLTSTEPGEGKSTLAISLARALAIAGHKTILIDADLKRPSVARLMGKKSPRDLVTLLPLVTDKLNLMSCLDLEEPSGLRILTAEATKKNQLSDTLIGSTSFVNLLEVACSKFEYVIIDCPPIGYVVDAKIISRFSDLVLYVVKQNSSSQQDVVAGLRQMASPTGYPLISLVLNSAHDLLGNNRSSHYNYYYARKA